MRGEQLQGLLRGTLELRTLGGMREERLVLQSDVRLSDGAFVALRFLLVRGASRVRGEAQIVDGKLTGSVTQLDAQGAEQPPERFERAWDPSAQPLSWALAFYPLLRDAAGPTLLRGRIYHGVEQALAPELAELAWTLAGDERTLSVKGALPGERVARAGVKGGALAWLELGDGGRALPLPAAEVERMVAAQPVSLE